MSGRAGFSLVEAVAALAAGALACGLAAALFRTETRLGESRLRRADRAETVRIAATVLRAEVATLEPLADVAAVGGDSMALRLLRGLAVTCAPAGGGALLVRYRGLREPDPSKDSVLSALGSGPAVPLEASAASAAACPGAGSLLRWTVALAPPAATPLLLFERGTYALSGRALRLRRGREGRQPLTAELLDDRASGFVLLPGGAAGASAAAGALVASPGVRVLLAFDTVPFAAVLRLPFLNSAGLAEAP